MPHVLGNQSTLLKSQGSIGLQTSHFLRALSTQNFVDTAWLPKKKSCKSSKNQRICTKMPVCRAQPGTGDLDIVTYGLAKVCGLVAKSFPHPSKFVQESWWTEENRDTKTAIFSLPYPLLVTHAVHPQLLLGSVQYEKSQMQPPVCNFRTCT